MPASLGLSLVSAPTLPSLLKENIVGYDAELVTVDFALLLQFKRSFLVSRQHPQGPCGHINGESHCTWAHWNTAHYRLDVDTNSDQFVVMRGYATDIALGYRAGLSLYVAPAFHLQAELDTADATRTILDRSPGVFRSAFDTVARGAHQYSFDPTMASAVVTSEPLDSDSNSAADQITSPTELQRRSEWAENSGLTLGALAAWASDQSLESAPRRDFNRDSAAETLAYLTDFAGLLGGAFVLLGHRTGGDA